jgi:hypothetical protein
MEIIKQFNTAMPPHFEANRTQVNVGITPVTKNVDEVEVEGYAYLTVCFEHPETYTDDALFEIAKKQARAYEVSRLIVEVDGFMLNADEISQERMNRTYVMLADGILKEWKDANNIWQDIPKETFKNAVIAAGAKQTELWVKYA